MQEEAKDQPFLDCSIQPNPNSTSRTGIEPSTGLGVEFRRYNNIDMGDHILQKYHGFVPE